MDIHSVDSDDVPKRKELLRSSGPKFIASRLITRPLTVGTFNLFSFVLNRRSGAESEYASVKVPGLTPTVMDTFIVPPVPLGFKPVISQSDTHVLTSHAVRFIWTTGDALKSPKPVPTAIIIIPVYGEAFWDGVDLMDGQS